MERGLMERGLMERGFLMTNSHIRRTT